MCVASKLIEWRNKFSRSRNVKICAPAFSDSDKVHFLPDLQNVGRTSAILIIALAYRGPHAGGGDLEHSINLTKEDGPAVVGAKNLLDAKHLRDEQSHGDRQLVHRAQPAPQIQRRDLRNVHRH